MIRLHLLALTALLAAPAAQAAAQPGTKVDDVQLPSLSGQIHLLQPGASALVLVFVKPNHPRCVEALQALASREGTPPGTRWVAVVPGDASPAEVRALAAAGGVKMPFLFDVGDRLYGKLEVSLHPTIAILDRKGALAAVEPYRRIQFADRVIAQVRYALGEITAAQLAAEEDPARAETHSDESAANGHVKFAGQLMKLEQLDQALSEVNKGLAMTPTAGGYGMQARILKRMGKCEEANKALSLAAKLDPGSGDALAAQEPCPLRGSRVQ